MSILNAYDDIDWCAYIFVFVFMAAAGWTKPVRLLQLFISCRR
jgi:hypothetical protein